MVCMWNLNVIIPNLSMHIKLLAQWSSCMLFLRFFFCPAVIFSLICDQCEPLSVTNAYDFLRPVQDCQTSTQWRLGVVAFGLTLDWKSWLVPFLDKLLLLRLHCLLFAFLSPSPCLFFCFYLFKVLHLVGIFIVQNSWYQGVGCG